MHLLHEFVVGKILENDFVVCHDGFPRFLALSGTTSPTQLLYLALPAAKALFESDAAYDEKRRQCDRCGMAFTSSNENRLLPDAGAGKYDIGNDELLDGRRGAGESCVAVPPMIVFELRHPLAH